ncbi:DUF6600 domain-containing protein [Archangium violaceum]|uniref:DUF6600 domain-containing protein n=1 Tax=Archangium violaceum TaxID=83451 RepID=UPI0036DC1DF4
MGSRMKAVSWLLATSGLCTLASLGLAGCATPEAGEELALESTPAGLSVNVEDPFYDALAPYGQWVEVPGVGRAWQPSPAEVGAEFVPYATGGQWVYSDVGWTFVTGWRWGWAPFHYGRWFLSPSFGWVWVPGQQWAPAWVDWRWGGGYVGWAPLPPAGFAVEPGWWTCLAQQDFIRPDVFLYRLPRERALAALHRMYPVTETVRRPGERWNQGPEPSQVRQVTGQPVPHAELHEPPPGEPPRPPPPARHEPPAPPPRAPPPHAEHPPAHPEQKPPPPPPRHGEPNPHETHPPREVTPPSPPPRHGEHEAQPPPPPKHSLESPHQPAPNSKPHHDH